MTAADDRCASRRQTYIKSLAQQADRAVKKYERQNDKLYRKYLIAIGREPEDTHMQVKNSKIVD